MPNTIIPQSNINAFIRVPGRAPTKLGVALQEWEGVWVQELDGKHFVHFPEAGEGHPASRLPVTEQIYEVALYTLATKRLTDWMRKNGKR